MSMGYRGMSWSLWTHHTIPNTSTQEIKSLSLAEKTTLRGLTRLEQFASPGSADISDNEKASNVLFQDEGYY
jgi:hypothetical protein